MWNDVQFQEQKKDLFSWFRLYVYKGRTFESLAEQSGYSAKTLARYVHQRLKEAVPVLELPKPTFLPQYLIIDGLWFGRLFVLLLYRIAGSPLVIHWSFAQREWGWHIAQDLRQLQNQGYVFAGFVTDGGRGVTSAIQEVHPHRPHQRCLVHVHREASKGLGKHPTDPKLKRLKQLCDHLFLIESKEALDWWVAQVRQWITDHQNYLQETTRDAVRKRWWFTHKKVRRTVRILLAAPNTSFVFTKGHPLCPRTTNEIEALNSLLTRRFTVHSGLATHRWQQLLSWFLYFRNLYYASLEKIKKA